MALISDPSDPSLPSTEVSRPRSVSTLCVSPTRAATSASISAIWLLSCLRFIVGSTVHEMGLGSRKNSPGAGSVPLHYARIWLALRSLFGPRKLGTAMPQKRTYDAVDIQVATVLRSAATLRILTSLQAPAPRASYSGSGTIGDEY